MKEHGMFDYQKPTVQMLGRFQPWHRGHTELFKTAHAKTGQVVIMIRETGEKHHDRNAMAQALAAEGFDVGRDYVVFDVPNIVNITYGRAASFHDLYLSASVQRGILYLYSGFFMVSIPNY